MTLSTPLEVYKLLPKTNCRECGHSSCLAFAAAIVKGEVTLSRCPRLDKGLIADLDGNIPKQVNLESIQQEMLRDLKNRIGSIDLAARAPALGARIGEAGIVITCLGKEFEIDQQGAVRSQCHTHAWFSLPLLDHVINSKGLAPTGNWRPFRELPGGQTWSRLFEQRCEKPLKQIADSHPDLFEDLITLFAGSRPARIMKADISVLLFPLPIIPMQIAYWRPDEGMESKLHLFFDETAEANLPIQSLFTMATGIAMMVEKIMDRH